MSRFSIILVLAPIGSVAGAPVSPADAEFFERQIRAILSENCWSCHGPKKQTAGLRLDTRAGLLKGGESGAAFDDKDPEKSRILAAVRHEGDLKMPPKAKLPRPAVDAVA